MTENTSNESNNSKGFEFLNEMSTEELKNILRVDCFSDDIKKLNDDTISKILQIITQREADGRDIDARLLWENFKMEYLPSIDMAEEKNTIQECDPTEIPHRKSVRFVKYAVSAALLCLLLGNCVAFAHGVNIFEYIANWNDETFHFEQTDSITPEYLNKQQNIE